MKAFFDVFWYIPARTYFCLAVMVSELILRRHLTYVGKVVYCKQTWLVTYILHAQAKAYTTYLHKYIPP